MRPDQSHLGGPPTPIIRSHPQNTKMYPAGRILWLPATMSGDNTVLLAGEPRWVRLLPRLARFLTWHLLWAALPEHSSCRTFSITGGAGRVLRARALQ